MIYCPSPEQVTTSEHSNKQLTKSVPKIRNLTDIVSWDMCLGCGVCAFICPEQKVILYNVPDHGIRPYLENTSCHGCEACLDVCPAVHVNFAQPKSSALSLPQPLWGNVLEVWEGYAADAEIRFKGASGGMITALSAYCLEGLRMHGVLHTGPDIEVPYLNSTRLSRCREDLKQALGSRYSPASVCDGLSLIEEGSRPSLFVGKPVDIAALRNAVEVKPALAEKIGATISFFCAETPATSGTLELLKRHGIDLRSLASVRYRGNGWPGHFAPTLLGQAEPTVRIPYKESWAFLQAFRPWSVQMWPDGTGELADLTCGDPWYKEPDGTNPGSSIVLVRTARGREILRGAEEQGYVKLLPAETWQLESSQKGLVAKKGAVWGRRLASRLSGRPVGNYSNAGLFQCWLSLSFVAKMRSLFGTLRRILTRSLYRPKKVDVREGFCVSRPENRTLI